MKLKRLIMLALCFALVCGLSVTAFADDTFTDYAEYSDGFTTVEAYAKIERYKTNGFIETTCVYNTSTVVEVSGRYEDYYRHEQIFSTSSSGYCGSSVWVEYYPIDGNYSENKIFALVDGNYYFRSTVFTHDSEEYYERWATVNY